MAGISIKMQLANLEKHLQPKIEKAMQKQVQEMIIATAIKRVNIDVYNSYTPIMYKRKKDDGGLTDIRNWEGTTIKNGISVRSIRTGGDGKYIPEVIETGEGYDYSGMAEGMPYAYEQPRPFIQNTKEELRKNGYLVLSLKEGLKEQGVKVK